MAAVPSIESLVLNFQRTTSLSGKEEPATPVCKGLPRKMGQSVVVFAAGSVFLLSAANTSAPVKRAHVTSNGRLIEHSPDSTEAIPLHLHFTLPPHKAEATRAGQPGGG